VLSLSADVLAAAADVAATASTRPLHWEDLGLSPIALDLGFFTLKWYSLAYLGGILLGYWHLSRMIKAPGAPMAQRHADDLFFYATIGIILGGRIGFVLFYNPAQFAAHPADILKLWEGGMSFHGGLIGTVLAIAWVSWRGRIPFLRACDYLSVCVPFGLLFGRLANFVNGELWGRVSDAQLPWIMVFPGGGPAPRHPSQLYEALLEGLVLMIVVLLVFWKTRARWRPGLLVGLFTLGYGLSRFLVEYYREPDEQLQEFARATGFSMGQWLTMPLILIGLFFFLRALVKPPLSVAARPAAA
jgi:phosphatidylglycerol:prolipoprotein diacylglycerol transferase